jgi:hypothetical protein
MKYSENTNQCEQNHVWYFGNQHQTNKVIHYLLHILPNILCAWLINHHKSTTSTKKLEPFNPATRKQYRLQPTKILTKLRIEEYDRRWETPDARNQLDNVEPVFKNSMEWKKSEVTESDFCTNFLMNSTDFQWTVMIFRWTVPVFSEIGPGRSRQISAIFRKTGRIFKLYVQLHSWMKTGRCSWWLKTRAERENEIHRQPMKNPQAT